MHLFRTTKLGISAAEAEWIFASCAKNAASANPEDRGKIALRTVETYVTNAAAGQKQPLELWGQELVRSFHDEAISRGHAVGLISSFQSFGTQPLNPEEFRREFMRFFVSAARIVHSPD